MALPALARALQLFVGTLQKLALPALAMALQLFVVAQQKAALPALAQTERLLAVAPQRLALPKVELLALQEDVAVAQQNVVLRALPVHLLLALSVGGEAVEWRLCGKEDG